MCALNPCDKASPCVVCVVCGRSVRRKRRGEAIGRLWAFGDTVVMASRVVSIFIALVSP